MIRLISLFFFVMFILLPKPTSASCLDPASCYCDLKPASGEVLIRAEVLQAGDATATIRALGIPFHDPEDLISSGQIFEDFGYDWPLLSQEDVGLFRVNPMDNYIVYSVIEVGGRYPCIDMPDFPGINMEELAQAVLSADCWRAVRAMGVVADCGDIVSGCCDTEKTMLHNSAPLILLLGFLVPRKRSRKAP